MNSKLKFNGTVFGPLAKIVPFLLPAIFFQSGIFALLSPLPLFICTLRFPVFTSIIAILTNGILLKSFVSPFELSTALFAWFFVGLCFPLFIKKTGKIQLSLLTCYAASILILVGLIYARAHGLGMNGVDYVRAEVSLGLDALLAIEGSPIQDMVKELGRETVYKTFLLQLPSGVLISVLLCFWMNLAFASQFIRGFISRSFWSRYKNPEWLLWPTLLFGALYIFAEHAPYFFGLNGLKLVAVLYGIQGLSILTHLFNRYQVGGLGRLILVGLAIFVVSPVLVTLGFLDLWIDFRRKLGQT